MCRIDNRWFADSNKGEDLGTYVYISPFPLAASSFLFPSLFVFGSVCPLVFFYFFLFYNQFQPLPFAPLFFRFILSLFDMSSRVTRSMSSSAERAPAQNTTTTSRGKLRGGRRPVRGGRTAAAAGQFALVREGDLNAAAGQLALGGAGDTAVAAGQPALVGGGETAGDGILVDGGKGAPGESSTIAGPQDVCCGFSEDIS